MWLLLLLLLLLLRVGSRVLLLLLHGLPPPTPSAAVPWASRNVLNTCQYFKAHCPRLAVGGGVPSGGPAAVVTAPVFMLGFGYKGAIVVTSHR